MAETGNSALSRQLEAAFAWWREAGVDCDYRDEAANWIAYPAATPGPAAIPSPKRADTTVAAPPPQPAIALAALPLDLAGFAAWWLAEPMLDDGRLAGRVAPRGMAGAQVMLIVGEPEREDHDELLSGPQGKLLDAMLSVMGLARSQVYLAGALPRHTPMADWAVAAQRGLGGILRHHIGLAAPKRLIAFGNNVLPLLGHDLPNSGEISCQFNHEGLSIPLFAATDLGLLLARPRAKARFWQQWLDWTGTGKT